MPTPRPATGSPPSRPVPPPGAAPSACRTTGDPVAADREPESGRDPGATGARNTDRSQAAARGHRVLRPRGDRGQVAVEFVGMVPLILLLVAAVWECVLIGYAFSLAGNAADEAARAGAVKGGGACAAAAAEHIGSAWNMTSGCTEAGPLYKATVTLEIPVLHPSLSFGRITGEAGAAMEREED